MSEATATLWCMDEFELPDGRKVRIADKALDNFDAHDECPLRHGRAAAHRGEAAKTNPFTDIPEGSVKYYETGYGPVAGWRRSRLDRARRASVVRAAQSRCRSREMMTHAVDGSVAKSGLGP